VDTSSPSLPPLPARDRWKQIYKLVTE
jgi:hypothetical protein